MILIPLLAFYCTHAFGDAVNLIELCVLQIYELLCSNELCECNMAALNLYIFGKIGSSVINKFQNFNFQWPLLGERSKETLLNKKKW